ncbi:TPA: hypothetical protein N0W96_002841 [Klebsiella oxytoca]|uniref:hypothetical protein n=1 Tax=Klebsiella oxytoca TaxID=571 RepID=UPI001324416C|nr:hypothetical protein [Klebsiella oxytoca]MXS16904.1 hypothetical protein [Klebsiella oxytoca]HCK6977920.1 hypothetical protein [Klebsiella oxytoca]HCK6989778.1 hypothetical protein [Klebsiella oxytoca]
MSLHFEMLIKEIIKTVTHGYYIKDKVMDNTFPIALNRHFYDNQKISVISLKKNKQEKAKNNLKFKVNFNQYPLYL